MYAKDWQQRYRLFSRYDEGIQMDYDGMQLPICDLHLLTGRAGWFSVTPENIAAQIAERCRYVSPSRAKGIQAHGVPDAMS